MCRRLNGGCDELVQALQFSVKKVVDEVSQV